MCLCSMDRCKLYEKSALVCGIYRSIPMWLINRSIYGFVETSYHDMNCAQSLLFTYPSMIVQFSEKSLNYNLKKYWVTAQIALCQDWLRLLISQERLQYVVSTMDWQSHCTDLNPTNQHFECVPHATPVFLRKYLYGKFACLVLKPKACSKSMKPSLYRGPT